MPLPPLVWRPTNRARPEAILALVVVACWTCGPARAAVPVSLTTGTYAQTFDGMANAQVSALPTGWAFASGTAPTWTSGTQSTTTQFAGTVGTGTLTSASGGGSYLFVSGSAASGTDKAIGFLSSSTYASPRSILFGFTNDTGGPVSAVTVGWNYEKYRNGTRMFDWKFYGSPDGSAWTGIAAGNRNYPADANSNPIPIVTSTVSPITVSGLSVGVGASYYLRWDYVGSGGSSNAQALGIDAVALSLAVGPSITGRYWDSNAATPGVGGSGTWSATSATFATTVAGTAVGTLAATGDVVFAGTAGTVTVAGTVAPPDGMRFMTDGYALAGGTVRLAPGATVAADAGVTPTVGSALALTGGTVTLAAGSDATLVVTAAISGSAALRTSGPGTTILAADNLFSGGTLVEAGWLRLGAGGTAGSVPGGIQTLSSDAAVVIDRSDDLTIASGIAGPGGLYKEGGNTVTLTGSSSYSGGTTLFAGTLVVGDGGTNGGILSSGPLDLSTGTRLAFDRSDDVVFSGTVAGDGTLVQRGDGLLALTQTGRIGPAFTLRVESGVANLDRSGASLVGMLGPGNTVELAGGALQLTSDAGEETKLTGAVIRVDGDGTIAIKRAGPAGDHVTTGFDSPLFIAGSGTLTFDYRGALIGPTLPPVTYEGKTTYTGTITLESAATIAVTNSAGGTAEVVFAGPLVDAGNGFGLVKAGDQTLTLAGSGGTFRGPTTVAAGTLRLASAAPLATSSVNVLAGATLAVANSTQTTVQQLDLSLHGKVDVAAGGVTVVAGMTPAALVGEIVEGRAGGSWNGTSGITSSVAATDAALGIPRAIGWLDTGGGSVTFAFAAPGDTNLDDLVDVLDAAAFLAGDAFDSGRPASWNQGDFTYDGVVDVLDAAAFVSTGLFDAGPYVAAPSATLEPGASGTPVAAVPEPATWLPVAACLAGWLAAHRRQRVVSARCCIRIRRTSAMACGW